MSRSKTRRKTTPVRRNVRKGGDFQRLHIKVSSPRIVMHQVMTVLTKALKYGTCLILLSLISYGGYLGYHHLYKDNPYYRLQAIEVDTNGYLSATRVADLAALDLDATVFDIDLDEVQKVLSKQPEIERCEVERRLPGTLQVKVTERAPVAWLQCEALGYPGVSADLRIAIRNLRGNLPWNRLQVISPILVDQHGVSFSGVFTGGKTLWHESRNLPVIVLREARDEDFEHGMKSKHGDLMSALSLMETIYKAGMRAEWRAVKIDLANDYSIEVMSHDGVKAVFGMWDHQRQVEDLISIREDCRNEKRPKIKTMNLIPEINIPVEFDE